MLACLRIHLCFLLYKRLNTISNELHIFHICALRNIYTYEVNQQIHIDKIYGRW